MGNCPMHSKMNAEEFDSCSSASTSSDDTSLSECRVCLDAAAAWSLPCGHRYCRECLEADVVQHTRDRDALALRCPEPTCRYELSSEDVRQYCLDAVWRDYDDAREQQIALRERASVACATPDCDGKLTSKTAVSDSDLRFCRRCERYTCTYCLGQHDVTVDCNDLDWENTASCPKCRTLVLEEVGCNLVRCRACQTKFCFLCNKVTDYSHFKDKTSPCHGKLGQPPAREMSIAALWACCWCLCIAACCVPCFACGVAIENMYRIYSAVTGRPL